jgi:hypothetical protein
MFILAPLQYRNYVFVGGLLYGVLSTPQVLEMRETTPAFYIFLNYFLGVFLVWVSAWFFNSRYQKTGKFNIDLGLIVPAALVVIPSYMLFWLDQQSLFAAITFFVVSYSALEISWIVTKKVGYILALIYFVMYVIVFTKLPMLEGKVIISSIAFGIMIIWKMVNFYFQETAVHNYEKNKKMEAYRATIQTLKHHFRNLSAAIEGFFKIPEEHRSPKIRARLNQSLHSIIETVEKLEKLDNYEEYDETSGFDGMIKVDKDSNSNSN